MIRMLEALVRAPISLSMLGLRRGPHITRYYMYDHLSRVLAGVPRRGRTLAISHSVALCEVLGLAHSTDVVEANYPEVNILSLPFEEAVFDFVVSNQVLEHVEGDPQAAIDETHRVLKPGGFAIHTTCFINPIHAAPNDFWRFTPQALRLLCRRFQETIDVGGWGNPYVWIICWLGLRYTGVPHAKWHPLHWIAVRNAVDWPIVTWVVAKK